MSLNLSKKYLKNFIEDSEINAFSRFVAEAHKMISEKTGQGNDFLGWVKLPEDYDKKEFERIKLAAKKYRLKAKYR